MDEIWHGEFSKVFTPYLPHIWYLSPTEMCPSPRWRRFKDSAKVRFCCQVSFSVVVEFVEGILISIHFPARSLSGVSRTVQKCDPVIIIFIVSYTLDLSSPFLTVTKSFGKVKKLKTTGFWFSSFSQSSLEFCLLLYLAYTYSNTENVTKVQRNIIIKWGNTNIVYNTMFPFSLLTDLWSWLDIYERPRCVLVLPAPSLL